MEITPIDEASFRKYCCERMAVEKDFIKLFYRILFQSAFDGKVLTHRQAFNLLNELYFNMTGKLRYLDYESFRSAIIRLENLEHWNGISSN